MAASPPSLQPSARLPVRYLSTTTCCGTPLHLYGCLLPAAPEETSSSSSTSPSEHASAVVGILAVLPYRASARSAQTRHNAPDVEPRDSVARMDDILQHRSISSIVVHDTDVVDVNCDDDDDDDDDDGDSGSAAVALGKPSATGVNVDNGDDARHHRVPSRVLKVSSGLSSLFRAIRSDTVQRLVNLLSMSADLVDPGATASISGALESRREGVRRVAALFATSVPVLQALSTETIEDAYRLREEIAATFVSARIDESVELARLTVDTPSETTHTFVEEVFAETTRATTGGD